VRTLGRLDSLLLPYWEKETNQAYVQSLADAFLVEIDALKAIANMPFALGSTKEDGTSAINPMSYVLLDSYKRSALPDVKLHILCTEDMPEDFLLSCMDSIKKGCNSLVFINDKLMVNGLIKLGIDPEDARQYTIVGCYEAAAKNEIPCSCSTRFSLPKALEYTLHKGKDMVTGHIVGLPFEPEFETFEALYDAFLQNTHHLVTGAINLTCCSESQMPNRHAAPLFSAVLEDCVQSGGDIYCNFAARYNNSSLMAVGLGTAVDALVAIRELVYERKLLTLPQLIEILDNNWEGQEALRQFARNKLPKYGCGEDKVVVIAEDIGKKLSKWVNGVPNGRGGIFRLSIFSIDWRTEWGYKTAASADGRKTGETLSQNASATFGMDRGGITALINSVTNIDLAEFPTGSVLDIVLHPSAVSGDDGLESFYAVLSTYFKKGGMAMHGNIFDAEVLKEAQENPEKYKNLQVRVCGWNAYFVNLSKVEQDAFIRQAEVSR
jgi:formate C-acetyltransferase